MKMNELSQEEVMLVLQHRAEEKYKLQQKTYCPYDKNAVRCDYCEADADGIYCRAGHGMNYGRCWRAEGHNCDYYKNAKN